MTIRFFFACANLKMLLMATDRNETESISLNILDKHSPNFYNFSQIDSVPIHRNFRHETNIYFKTRNIQLRKNI